MSNFSFTYSFFQRLVLQTNENKGLFGKGLTLPNDKIVDLSKFKEFADNKINVTQKQKFALRRLENIVGKRENAGYQHLLLFPQCFQKTIFSGSLKVIIVW